MTGRFVHLRNIGRDPIDVVQDDAPNGIRRIHPGEDFNTDERTALILLKVGAPNIIEIPEELEPAPRDSALIVPRNAGDLQQLLAEATAQ